jgi:hypothetical protein
LRRERERGEVVQIEGEGACEDSSLFCFALLYSLLYYHCLGLYIMEHYHKVREGREGKGQRCEGFLLENPLSPPFLNLSLHYVSADSVKSTLKKSIG